MSTKIKRVTINKDIDEINYSIYPKTTADLVYYTSEITVEEILNTIQSKIISLLDKSENNE